MAPQQIVGVILFFVFILIFPTVIEGAEWQGCSDSKKEYKLLSPASLKRGTKMNWVGCTLTWIGLGVVSPLMFIYKCIYNLFHL